jgi:hypothetical protein
MIWNALVAVALAPLASLAARELRIASTTDFIDDGGWRDIRRHEEPFGIFTHFMMLIAPILGFVILLVAILLEFFS